MQHHPETNDRAKISKYPLNKRKSLFTKLLTEALKQIGQRNYF